MSSISKHDKKEAERIRDVCMREKLFWYFDKEDHFSELDFVLNTLYNDNQFKGNIYEASIKSNQSGRKLIVICKVCNCTELTSYDPFMSHDRGKLHKKKVHDLNSEDVELPNLTTKLKCKDDGDIFENNFEEGTLEHRLSKTSFPVVGWQFVYREFVEGTERFGCQLCKNMKRTRRMDKEAAFKHITSDTHMMQYLICKYGIKANEQTLLEEIKDVVSKEGVIQSNILTIGASEDEKTTVHRKSASVVLEADEKDAVRQLVESGPKDFEEFNKDIERHYFRIRKPQEEERDFIINQLKDDVDGIDLLIQFVKVLSQKMALYGQKEAPKTDVYGRERKMSIESITKRLLRKTEYLQLPTPVKED